jgi:hypothetical protein
MNELNQKTLVNRVAQSPLKTINLEVYYPQEDIVELDIKQYLFKDLLLKEKDFRRSLKEEDWSVFSEKRVCVFCSSDAIIPVWAYMLIASYLKELAVDVFQGTKREYLKHHYSQVIESKDWSVYEGGMLVIKGCSDKPVPPSAYMALTSALLPYVKSLMYGEPCSTVPIYKRPKNPK